MKQIIALTFLIVIAGSLNAQQKNDEWIYLFDGKTTNGWHTYGQSLDSIGSAWQVVDGTLHLDATQKNEWQVVGGGDIVCNEEFEDFHLDLEWKISKDGNSGIIFYVHEESNNPDYQYPWQTGPEMQVLDNNGHPDAKILKHRAGDLYDLISAKPETVKPAGEWNHAEVISHKGKLQLKLNDVVVVETTLWDDAWFTMIKGSKFKDMAKFGTFKKGKISLQDHGDNVWYRNVRIKRLN